MTFPSLGYFKGSLTTIPEPMGGRSGTAISPIFPLDNIGATATEAFGLYRLTESYTGALIRVLRVSDSVEQDFSYTATNWVDDAAVLSFLGGSDGYVVRAYGQIAGNDFIQGTVGVQPKYVSNAGGGYPGFEGRTNSSLEATSLSIFRFMYQNTKSGTIVCGCNFVSNAGTSDEFMYVLNNCNTAGNGFRFHPSRKRGGAVVDRFFHEIRGTGGTLYKQLIVDGIYNFTTDYNIFSLTSFINHPVTNDFKYYENENLIYSSTAVVGFPPTAANSQFGQRVLYNSDKVQGGEWAIFEGILSDIDRAQLISDLRAIRGL